MQQQRFRGLGGIVSMRAGGFYCDHYSNISVHDNYTHRNKTQDFHEIFCSGNNLLPQHKVFAAEIWHGDILVLETDKQEELRARLNGAKSPHECNGHTRHPHCDKVNMSEREANGNIPLRRHGRQSHRGQRKSDSCIRIDNEANVAVHFDTVDSENVEQHGEHKLQRVAEEQMSEQDVARTPQQEGLTQQSKHHNGIDIKEEKARQHSQQSFGRVVITSTQRLIYHLDLIHFLWTDDTRDMHSGRQ